MKTYCGRRDKHGDAVVHVIDNDGDSHELRWRLDLANHSPTGLEWGYGGSGPAQLALAILADVIRAPLAKPRQSGWMDDDFDTRTIAVRLHQDFKWKFIASLDRDKPWKITEQEVIEFVEQARKETA